MHNLRVGSVQISPGRDFPTTGRPVAWGWGVGFGNIIREERNKAELTQRELATALGCTDGYVAHLEKELKVPSIAMTMALIEVLRFNEARRTEFLGAVESARVDRAGERIRTRGAMVRDALRSKQASTGGVEESLDPENIARDLARNPKLRQAYLDLKTALANRDMRDAVVKALRAFANSAKAS